MVIVMLLPIPAAFADYIYWSPSNPLPDGVNLEAAVWDGTRYLAVGKNGVIASSNGANWTIQESVSIQHLYGIAYNGTRYVAVGKDGIVLSSADGQTWSADNSLTTRDLWGVRWINGRFIAFGASDYISSQATLLSSPDGINWTRIPDLDTGGATLLKMDGDGIRLVAVGTSGLVMISDGNAWYRYNLSAANFGVYDQRTSVILKAVALDPTGSGKLVISAEVLIKNIDGSIASTQGFLVSGNLIAGTNPLQLDSSPTPTYGNAATDLAWDSTQVLAIDSIGTLYASATQGTSWSTFAAPPSKPLLKDLVGNHPLNPTQYVAVGHGNSARIDPTTHTLTLTPSALISDLSAITVGGAGLNTLVATGSGALYVNVQDTGWTPVTLPVGILSADLSAIHWDGTQFLASGLDINATTAAIILSSNDGITWFKQIIPSSGNALRGLARAGSTSVAVGDKLNILFNSGADWSNAVTLDPSVTAPATTRLNGIASDGNVFFAVGNNGTLLASNNGINWSQIPLNLGTTPPNLNAIRYLDSEFVIVGDKGTILVSADGGSWVKRNTGVDPTKHFYDAAWGNGQYLIVGSSDRIYYKKDAKDPLEIWKEMDIDTLNASSWPAINDLHGITWDSRRFHAVGQDGFMLRSSGADVFVTLSDGLQSSRAMVTQHDTVHYAVTLGNIGNFNMAPASQLSLNVVFPVNMAIDTTSLPADCSVAGNQVHCTLSAVTAKTNQFLTFSGKVMTDIPVGTLGSLSTTAQLTTDNPLESSYKDNLASVTTTQQSLTDYFKSQEAARVSGGGVGGVGWNGFLLWLMGVLIALRRGRRHAGG